MEDTPQAPVDPAAADQARELAQAISTRNEAEANLTNAVATGDNKLIADRGRGYVTAAREVGKLSSIVAGVPGDPTAQPGQEGGSVRAMSDADVELAVETAIESRLAPVIERIDNICANLPGLVQGSGPTAGPEFKPGKAAWIVVDGEGAGFVVEQDDLPDGHVALRLTTEARWKGTEHHGGEVLIVPAAALTREEPAPEA